MRAFGRWTILSVLAMVAFTPAAAQAHSNSVDSDPADDSTVATLPRVATVTFNEPVSEAAFALTQPDGKVVKVKAGIAGPVVKATLPTEGAKGAYVLAYRVVSEDGHPVTGEIEFTVMTGPAAKAPAASTPAPGVAGKSWALGVPLWAVIGGAAVLLAAAVVLVRSARR